MALTPGTRLGVYEVTAHIGEGGMGQVFRARDTKLNRDVALKVLPDSLANDSDRLARFTREAQTLASLNHPNIAHIHGLEESGGVRALVMELVEGDDLSQRLSHGAIPIDEALPIARQIAAALEAAHEQGIIHRDLKPANIKVRPDGTVKVLDFGLAKALDPAAASSPEAMNSPTITSPAVTRAGMILGTAAYMAPEQARGKPVDRRADVWAFGAVLFEMLTGQRAFGGDDVVETLANVINQEPAWDALPPSVPAHVHQALRLCLKRSPRERVPDIGAVRLALEGAFETAASQLTSTTFVSSRGPLPWIAAAAIGATALVVGAGVSAWYFRRAPAAPTIGQAEVRLSLVPPADVSLASGVNQLVPVVSPDGRHIAFSASQPGEPIRIWVRSLESQQARSLPGTDNARGPFWSPDSRRLGFFANDKLKTIDAAGGPVQTVCDVVNSAGNPGATWNRAGTILFARRTGGLMKVAAAGGNLAPATVVDASSGDGSHVFPVFLPDGRRFLYISRPSNTLWLGALDATAATRLLSTDSQVLYSDGYLLFARQGTLLAQSFDVRTTTLGGDPTAIADRLAVDPLVGAPAFSTSDTGVLVYRTGAGNPQTQLIWVDRSGKEIGKVGPVGAYRNPVLSGDETRVALEVADTENRTQDLSILDLKSGAPSRFTVDRGNDIYPVWSPDDSRIAFGSDRPGGNYNLYEKTSSGSAAERLLLASTGDNLTGAYDWSPDGEFLLFRDLSPETSSVNIGILPFSGDRATRNLFAPSNFIQTMTQISPDGRWVAYNSSETGRHEVYVARFPNPTGKWSISKDGGSYPRWRGDSRELYYYAAEGRIMAVPISGTATLEIGAPVPLFSARLLGGPMLVTGFRQQYDVTADGKQFLLNVPVDDEAFSPAITVVLNWATGLRR